MHKSDYFLHFSLRISRPSSSRLWKKPIKNSPSRDEPMACWYWSGHSLSRLTWASCPLSTMKPNWATPWQGEKSAFNYWILSPSLSSSSQVLFLSDTASLEYVSCCFIVWMYIACEMCQAVRHGHCDRMCLVPIYVPSSLFTFNKTAFLMWLNRLERQFLFYGMLWWPFNIFNKYCGSRLVCRSIEWLKEVFFKLDTLRVHLTPLLPHTFLHWKTPRLCALEWNAILIEVCLKKHTRCDAMNEDIHACVWL